MIEEQFITKSSDFRHGTLHNGVMFNFDDREENGEKGFAQIIPTQSVLTIIGYDVKKRNLLYCRHFFYFRPWTKIFFPGQKTFVRAINFGHDLS